MIFVFSAANLGGKNIKEIYFSNVDEQQFDANEARLELQVAPF